VAYRRLSAALWFAGVGTFMLLYAVQPLLPLLSAAFDVPASTSSLALSVTTGALALSIVPISAVAEAWGRTRVMSVSLTAAAVLGLLAPLAPSFGALLAIRALQGVAIAGLPALAMAHLTEEVHPRFVGGAVGVFIAGNTVGGLAGRLVASAVADVTDWRAALAVVGGLSVGCLVLFRVLVPAAASRPAAVPARVLASHLLTHLRDPGLRLLCATGFVLMSAFVTVYNYLGFRLLEAPFLLSQTVVGLAYLAYLAGTGTSAVAGRLGDRLGRAGVLWASALLTLGATLLTLPDVLPLVVAGLVLFTVGFFAAHSVASGWVGRRATAARGQASALYLLSYYAGSSIGGSAGGLAYDHGRWPGVVAFVAALAVVALGLALALRRVRPPLSPR
jgi:YNFM family putative membrane transporter